MGLQNQVEDLSCFETIDSFRLYVDQQRAAGKRIGFVPTMGYLHDGHLSLVRAARQSCDIVTVSIFVNPRQFSPQEDLEAYPRDMERDLQLAHQAGADAVFAPAVEEMYPTVFNTEVIVHDLTDTLCGASRPGHFKGVTTVVAKLFNIVGPANAYFGQKDYQQAAVIRKMAADLAIPINVVTCPTVREKDGLAMSSRNAYLSPPQRQAALVLWHALQLAKHQVDQGERRAAKMVKTLQDFIRTEPSAEIDYVAIRDPRTLQQVDSLSGTVLIALAVHIGKTRLIDNMLLPVGSENNA
jgi:pantoate--beta-alanine ligase